MGMALMILVSIVFGLGLFTLFAVGQYNTLVALRNRYKNSFSQIDGQLKIRYDLIANMVEGGRTTSRTTVKRWTRSFRPGIQPTDGGEGRGKPWSSASDKGSYRRRGEIEGRT